MFQWISDGEVHLELDEIEAKLLEQLLDQMIDLLQPFDVPQDIDPLERMVGMNGPTQAPQDPALARIFPNAYEDEVAAGEFRQYTEPDLRATKISHARTARETLENWQEELMLDSSTANAWLLALNDLRLTLGTRIGIGQLRPPDEDLHNEQDPAFHLYDWLTYLQGTLVDAIAKH